MKIDWYGVLIALLVTSLIFFILIKTTEMIGFCLVHDIPPTTHCQTHARDVIQFDSMAILITIVRPFLIPIFAFALGIIYYFKGHPIKKWTDVLLPSFVIGFLSGLITLFILIWFQSPILFDLLYLFTILSWVGFFIGIAVVCSVIGGLIVYRFSKKD